ncbi:uncharacterized protein F4812DRAFT_470337 [Daldinia caldariorum]|uniref:uncharacterized protein n=1 Tax=Daldinia caldariorum TaxID=326644 RepID=UPI0020086B2D|nr:uncharacterized protein F4812DRAFT_470337 [Daldinia caldariorum]KAI1469316.1 hypothetical protein F4812DRAFT_470337 [Daldinia caldariorum]
MVQLAQVAIIFTTALAGFTTAKSCEEKDMVLTVCDTRDYINKIITNLRANNMPTDDNTIQQSLWSCLEHGDIQFKEMCTRGCVGGDKKDDYCTGSPDAGGEKRDEPIFWEA